MALLRHYQKDEYLTQCLHCLFANYTAYTGGIYTLPTHIVINSMTKCHMHINNILQQSLYI